MVYVMPVEAVVPIVLSVIALAFSIYVFIDSRKRDRRDIFIKIHELLISDDIQRGRYLLFEKVVDQESVKRLTDDEYRDINRAIAAYNLLGVYLKNGYMNERDVMEVWGRPVYRAWISAQPFLAWREHNQGYKAMPYFEALARRTEQVLSRDGLTSKICDAAPVGK
jgi:hypothetical protein